MRHVYRTLVLLAAVLLIGIGSANAQSVTTGTSKLGWTQDAPDLATAQAYTYTHYDDVSTTGVVLTTPTCANQTPIVVGTFDCQAPFPAFTPGAHTLAITAKNVAGESLKSAALSFQFVIIPSPPRLLKTIAG